MSVPNGDDVMRMVRSECDHTLLAFSCGKDAIATWLKLREHFENIHAYYLYLVPGLEFIEESLAYYERYFGLRIRRLPHPSLHRWLNELVFQPPERCRVIEQANLPMHDYADIRKVLIEDLGLSSAALVADGVRAADSPLRRVAIMKHGPVSRAQGRYHPIWDMRNAELVALLASAKVRLPVDYAMFGRSFDGLDARFLVPLKTHRPADYRRVLEWFPLAELEVWRYERQQQSKAA